MGTPVPRACLFAPSNDSIANTLCKCRLDCRTICIFLSTTLHCTHVINQPGLSFSVLPFFALYCQDKVFARAGFLSLHASALGARQALMPPQIDGLRGIPEFGLELTRRTATAASDCALHFSRLGSWGCGILSGISRFVTLSTLVLTLSESHLLQSRHPPPTSQTLNTSFQPSPARSTIPSWLRLIIYATCSQVINVIHFGSKFDKQPFLSSRTTFGPNHAARSR
jgi:hypothetical protein